jgi:hypothetical protein
MTEPQRWTNTDNAVMQQHAAGRYVTYADSKAWAWPDERNAHEQGHADGYAKGVADAKADVR